MTDAIPTRGTSSLEVSSGILVFPDDRIQLSAVDLLFMEVSAQGLYV